jgi:threo-3-hydroxy-L-aspartate ammonia-lyase
VPVGFEDVRAAARRLSGVAHRTPVATSQTLNARVGGEVFLKCENLQRGGAFKFRGAYNRLAQLDELERKRGVVAFSSGNHAQGVALAAKLLGAPATIVMPSDAPEGKVQATRSYGAEIIFYERTSEDRDAIAQRIARERGGTLVPPFDDERIVAGAGTAVLELLEETALDAIVVPVGGGGLFAGSCISGTAMSPGIALWGVEPETGNDFARSFERGERVSIDVPKTIADGLQTTSPGAITFPIVREHARGILTVTDRQLCEAMRFAFERMKLVIEPSGAAALAAALSGRLPERYRKIGVIVSGGNVDARRFAELVGQAA